MNLKQDFRLLSIIQLLIGILMGIPTYLAWRYGETEAFHELKSPLTSLLGFSDILCRDDLSEEDRKQFALIIKRNSGRMMGIINDLLMLATLERDEERIPMQDNAIKEILSDTLQDTSYKAQQKQTRVVVEDHTGEDGHGKRTFGKQGRVPADQQNGGGLAYRPPQSHERAEE